MRIYFINEMKHIGKRRLSHQLGTLAQLPALQAIKERLEYQQTPAFWREVWK